MKISFPDNNLPDRSFDTDIITVGREEDNTLQLLSDGISRHHGRIFCADKSIWFIEDLGSTNGITLNGKKVTIPTKLSENDIIAFHQDKICVSELNENKTLFAESPVSTDTAKISITDVIVPNSDTGITIDPIMPAPDNGTPLISISPAEAAAENKEKEPELEKIAEFIQQNTSNLFNNEKRKKNKEHQETANAPKYKFSNKIFYVTLICAIIVLGAVFIRVLDDKNKPAAAKETQTVQDHPLYLSYIKENITADNVFRFTLVIENGQASFSVDDLKSQLRYGPIVKAASEVEIAKLKEIIRESQFMKLKPVPAGMVTNNEREFKEIAIYHGPENNRISLKNRPAPREFIDVEDAINIFAESCNMATFSLTPEELQEQALNQYRLAEDKLANYETNLAYLKEAINGFNIVIEYLAGVTPEPKLRRDAAEKNKRAKDLRDNFIRQYRSQYTTALNTYDINTAKRSLQALLDLYDINTNEYQRTKERLIKIDILSRSIKAKRER